MVTAGLVDAHIHLDKALLGVAAHVGADPELHQVLDTLPVHPARILRLPDHGLAVGGRADLVIWEAERAGGGEALARALTAVPGKTTVPPRDAVPSVSRG